MNTHSRLSGLDLPGDDDGLDEGAPGALAGAGDRDWDAEARVVGWKPLPADPENPQPHEYRGDPAKWTDSRTFVLRGEAHMPVMREQLRRLTEKNLRQEKELGQLRTTVEQNNAKIDDLIVLAKDARASGYKQARKELEQQQREALRNGDEATFDRVSAGLKEIDQAEARVEKIGAKPTEPAPPAPPASQLSEDVQAFIASNPWFTRDKFLHDQMIAEHMVVLKKHPAMPEAQQLEAAKTSLRNRFPEAFGIEPRQAAPTPEPVEEVDDDPAPAPRRHAAAVAVPRGAPEGGPRSRGPFERIAQTDRAEARREFERLQVHDAGLTAEEYVETYLNPSADIVALQRKFRSKK